jgi:hypothetical protein
LDESTVVISQLLAYSQEASAVSKMLMQLPGKLPRCSKMLLDASGRFQKETAEGY